MDVERKIEFILDSQVKTEIRLTGITKLLQQGMRMLVRTDSALAQLAAGQKRTDARVAELQMRTDAKFAELAFSHKELAAEMRELARAQKQTERILQAFIKGQRNGRNGR